jgi:hypothetical protein
VGESPDTGGQLAGAGDERLLAALHEMFGPKGTPPGWSVELAKGSYGLRALDAELAQLTSDSEASAAVSQTRAEGGPRLLVFEAPALSVDIEIEPAGRTGRWRLIGQLTPAATARIQVRQAPQPEPAWIDADELGRFTVDDLAGGPLSLVCVPAGQPATATAWITIG